jgi:Zn-dependent protease/predicted transcriptional regulator
MFKNSITLFSIFGFKIRIDPSWIIIAVLITWSLSVGFFPHYHKGLSTQTYWLMGALGALGLFASILFHELSHSLVARHYGLDIGGITLFLFGGVSEMTTEPESPKVEFLMALAGPMSSLVLGSALYGVFVWGQGLDWPGPAMAVVMYLGLINWILAAFNLLPAFPLDGGRVLRSALWRFKGDLRWATSIASKFGSFFGILLIILGIMNLLTGNPIGGVWFVIIGIFLRSSAQMSYQQLLVKNALEGRTVDEFMSSNTIAVSPDATIQELIEDYVYRHHFKMFPIVRNNKELLGCVQTKSIKDIPREQWSSRRVGDIFHSCSDENTVSPGTDVAEALNLMRSSGNSRLMVVDSGRLKGIIALKDIAGFLNVRREFEE